jgi:hypothetical protein
MTEHTNHNVTLLTHEQICDDKALQVIKSYGKKVGMSDLAVLIGGAVSSSNATTSDGQRSARVWSASSYDDGGVCAVNEDGDRNFSSPLRRDGGARPALPSSVASSIGLSEAKPSRKISGVDVVEYGEYPQTIADENITRELEQAFSRNQLQKTGKTYNFDSEKRDAYDKPFKAKENAEYQHKGKKYIRVEANPYEYDNDHSVLSNGKNPKTGEVYWVEVQPIEWLRDPSGICVARQALFARVQFDRKKKYDGNFENTDMARYLNQYFWKEMQPSRAVEAPAPAIRKAVIAGAGTVGDEAVAATTLQATIHPDGAPASEVNASIYVDRFVPSHIVPKKNNILELGHRADGAFKPVTLDHGSGR